jgi:serine protease Do
MTSPPAKKTLYEILGVAPRATQAEIKAAYEDKAGEGRVLGAAQRLALKEAFSVLSNDQRRSAYDSSLRNRSLSRAREAVSEESSGWGKRAVIIGALSVVVVGAWFTIKRPSAAVKPGPAVVRSVSIPAPESNRAVNEAAQAGNQGPPLTAEQLYATTSQSVVRINVSQRDGSQVGMGSGVVIGQDTVITNCHVALAGEVVQVREQQGLLSASIIVADEEFDLCKLRVSGLSGKPVSIGTSTQLNVGQKVFAIGSPQGLDLTLSDGLVSSLREGPSGTFIQTTAPVSPGSSGGGLFDQRGKLVGIITFQMRSGQNLNFAIPVEWLDNMSNRSRDTGREVGGLPARSSADRPTRD